MRFFCVSHRPPAFDPGTRFTMVSPAPGGGADAIAVADDFLGDRFHGDILSEYVQLFGLARHLAGAEAEARICIFQYRKFLALGPGARRSTNMAYAFASPAEEAAALFPGPRTLGTLRQSLMVGPALAVRSLAGQYGDCHRAEDFVAFVLSLSQIEGFDLERCARFAGCPVLFPAPSLGIHRIGDFRRDMAVLERVWGDHAGRFPVRRRKGYQRRVGGFLLERLHSFLLQERLLRQEESCFFASQIVVSDSTAVRQGT